MHTIAKTLSCAALGVALATSASAQDASMTFFITSVGPGNGADLGGLEGADAYCAQLAEAAGVSGKTWHAYLSTSDTDARDRIGSGPWHNAKGEMVAESLEDLHNDPNINKQTGLDEKGDQVNGRGDSPNRHDILTGSTADGTKAEQTCSDWTSSGDGSTIVGHHDRMGLRDDAPSKSWNASHPTRGCDQESLRSTGGDGLFYCFAMN